MIELVDVTERFSDMTDPLCPRCRGSGWVCADHPDRSFDNDDLDCDCGAEGVACVCNPEHVVQWQTVFSTTDPNKDKPTPRN